MKPNRYRYYVLVYYLFIYLFIIYFIVMLVSFFFQDIKQASHLGGGGKGHASNRTTGVST